MTKLPPIRQANSAGRIAFEESKLFYLDAVNKRYPELHINICTINANGTDRRQLTPASGHYASPAFNPDGSKIAYSIAYNHIGLMNADGTQQVVLAGNTSGYPSKCHTPCFSPDGRKIAFIAASPSSWALYVMNADGTAPTQITHDGVPRNPVFSADGKQIIYDRLGPHVVDTNGKNQRKLFPGNPTDYNEVAVSPDGRKIAVVDRLEIWPEEDVYEHLYTIYVTNYDGSQLTKVSGAFKSANHPTFSPDGERIAFVGQLTEDAVPGIYTTRLDGSDIEVVTTDAKGVAHLSWAPMQG